LAVLLIAAGCGGSDSDPADETAATPPAVLKEANANCRRLLVEAKQLGKGVLSRGYEGAIQLTSEGLIRPGLPLLRSVAAEQQSLARRTDNAEFDLYARLFDPIVVLTERRLAVSESLPAGLPTHPEIASLEDQIDELTEEQQLAARGAGLADCDVDFRRVLISSLSP